MSLASELVARVQEEAARFGTEPYLLTVTPALAPHCRVVPVNWDVQDARVVVRAPSGWPALRACGHTSVTLLWPPTEPGGYSLIVDASADGADPSDGVLALAITRAVLHRAGGLGAPEDACGSDCLPVIVT